MEDKHLIANIIAEKLEETPAIDGVNINRLIEDSGLPAYKVDRVIDELVGMGILERNNARVAVMFTNKFIYGYKYGYKRLYYDEFDGKCLRDKMQHLKGLKDRFNRFEINEMDYYYVFGRVDQNCFSAGYL